jgi:hypothetical protein
VDQSLILEKCLDNSYFARIIDTWKTLTLSDMALWRPLCHGLLVKLPNTKVTLGALKTILIGPTPQCELLLLNLPLISAY